MKKARLYLTLLSISGVLFAGYLSLSKLLAGVCPLNEGCPLFLGYPACYTGLILFSALLFFSLAYKIKMIKIVAFAGVIFSLYSTYKDLAFPSCPGGVCNYSMLLPTCVYGFLMYLAVLVIAFKAKHE